MAKEKENKKSSEVPEGLEGETEKKYNPNQENLDIDRIEDGFVYLKNGGMRIILMVSAVNFSLKNEEEQNSIIGGYQSFLNSLSFPIQIITQSRKLDLTGYLQGLEEKLDSQSNELLRAQMADYIDFVRRIVDVANIMDKNFFVCVPYEPLSSKELNPFEKIISGLKGKRKKKVEIKNKDAAKKELRQRAGLVASGLSSIGIRAVQLNSQEIIELLYTSYNPASAQFKKIANPADVLEPIIRSEKDKKGE
jgi:hypothetical protein